MVKVALVVSIIALAVCLLTALHGVLSDGLKGLKQRSKPISISFLIYAVAFCFSSFSITEVFHAANQNVNLNVGNTALLSNINLTLEQGKIYGVLGPNGAGKTTLFKSMLGLTAFSGEILSDGQPVSSRCFGSLIEYPAFYPRLTVEENLKLHAQYLGLKRPNIEVALKQVNLLDARKSCSLNFLWGCANDWELLAPF